MCEGYIYIYIYIYYNASVINSVQNKIYYWFIHYRLVDIIDLYACFFFQHINPTDAVVLVAVNG